MKKYDESDPISIELYAKELIGRTFADVIRLDDGNDVENARMKGQLGQIIEQHHFHYLPNNVSGPDFEKAGIELKVTPFKKNKNGEIIAKERLILTMINYGKVVQEEFETSQLLSKSKLLLILYQFVYDIKSKMDYKIVAASLFTPSDEDMKIIREDYEKIVEKIRAGKAHELSEGDTNYLGAATKGASSKDRRKQPFSDVPAMPRAFSFKQSYMTEVIRRLLGQSEEAEKILHTDTKKTFDDFVLDTINAYRGKSESELFSLFGIKTSAKNRYSMLSFRMLGIKSNNSEEFIKAGITVKTIRLEEDGSIREHMSFPPIRFTELARETWEESTLRETFSSRFLFVVFRKKGDNYVLAGCQFWTMPLADLYEARRVWVRTKRIVRAGIPVLKVSPDGRRTTALPKESENRVCHVRPHARNAADTEPLPNGGAFTKQSFWLHRRYILSQLNTEVLADL